MPLGDRHGIENATGGFGTFSPASSRSACLVQYVNTLHCEARSPSRPSDEIQAAPGVS